LRSFEPRRGASSRSNGQSGTSFRISAPFPLASVSSKNARPDPLFRYIKFFRELFFRQSEVRRKIPGLEFIGVDRFSGIVFGEALAKIAGRADVDLIGGIPTSQNIRVVHPPSLPARFGGRGKPAFACNT
jgi:hypothetical protein